MMLKEALTCTENKSRETVKRPSSRSYTGKRIEVIRLATTIVKDDQVNKIITVGFREPHFYSLVSVNTFGPTD